MSLSRIPGCSLGGFSAAVQPQVEHAHAYCKIPNGSDSFQLLLVQTRALVTGRLKQEVLHNPAADSLLKASVMDGSIVWGWGMASTAGMGVGLLHPPAGSRALPASKSHARLFCLEPAAARKGE